MFLCCLHRVLVALWIVSSLCLKHLDSLVSHYTLIKLARTCLYMRGRLTILSSTIIWLTDLYLEIVLLANVLACVKGILSQNIDEEFN